MIGRELSDTLPKVWRGSMCCFLHASQNSPLLPSVRFMNFWAEKWMVRIDWPIRSSISPICKVHLHGKITPDDPPVGLSYLGTASQNTLTSTPTATFLFRNIWRRTMKTHVSWFIFVQLQESISLSAAEISLKWIIRTPKIPLASEFSSGYH